MSNYDDDRYDGRRYRSDAFDSGRSGDGMGMVATGGRSLWNMFREVAAENGVEFFGKLAGAAATRFSPANAKSVEKYTGVVVGGVIRYAGNLMDVGDGILETNKLKDGLLDDVGIFLKAEFEGKLSVNPSLALMRSKNEVIEVSAGKVRGYLKSHMINVAAGLVEHAPDVARKHGLLDKATDRMTNTKIGGETGAQLNQHQANAILENSLDYGMKTVMPWVQKSAKNMARSKYDGETALDMIKNLAKQFGESSRGDTRISTSNGDSLEMGDYIVEILKTHQKNTGKPALTDRAHYYDEICKAAKLIASEIESGAMDPMGLVYLVGNRKIMTDGLKPAIPRPDKEENAKGADPKKEQAPKVEETAARDTEHGFEDPRYEASIRKAVSEVKSIYDRHKDVDVKEFLANTAYSRREIKPMLDALEGEDKAFMAQLFPRSVLRKAGVPEDEINSMRTQVSESFETRYIHTIKELGAKEEKELHGMGFGKNDASKLREAAEMNLDGPDAMAKLRRAGLATDIDSIFTNVKGDWVTRVSKRDTGNAVLQGAEKQDKTHADRVKNGRGGDEEISLAT